MATRTRETGHFTITAGNMDVFHIVQFTEFAVMQTAGGESEHAGKVWYKTEDGKGVNRLADGTYYIPSLDVTGVDNKAVQS